MDKCKTCKFLGVQGFHGHQVYEEHPACRKNAPVPGKAREDWAFPVVDPDEDWCGEHEYPDPEERLVPCEGKCGAEGLPNAGRVFWCKECMPF